MRRVNRTTLEWDFGAGLEFGLPLSRIISGKAEVDSHSNEVLITFDFTGTGYDGGLLREFSKKSGIELRRSFGQERPRRFAIFPKNHPATDFAYMNFWRVMAAVGVERISTESKRHIPRVVVETFWQKKPGDHAPDWVSQGKKLVDTYQF